LIILYIEFNKFYRQTQEPQSTGVAFSLTRNNYYFWTPQDLLKPLPFICEISFKDIGCLNDPPGSEYQGQANRTQGGDLCLSWKSPGLLALFDDQGLWNHNYCRNQGGLEESPICFIDQENYDYCIIPQCNQKPRRDLEDTHTNIAQICQETFRAGGREGLPPQQFIVG
jgi:hypothetical protein